MKTKKMRSIIHEYFPLDCRIELQEITESRGIDTNAKIPHILDTLNKYKVPYNQLGSGTNRYAIQVDGYVVKIALDEMGMTDNKREFKYGPSLYPYVIKTYECLRNGLLNTCEYVTVFSYDDWLDNQDDMRDILKQITEYYAVGDIGITADNYLNWGFRNNGEIVILDFAYIYSLSYKNFLCSCEDNSQLAYDRDYNYLVCPTCKKKYAFVDIRRRISDEDERKEIGDIRDNAYVLKHDEQEVELVKALSPYAFPKKKEKKEKIKIPKQKVYEPDIYEQESILDALDNELRKNRR